MTRRALVIHHLRSGVPDAATQMLSAADYALDHVYPIEGDPFPDPDEGHAVALVHGSLADVTKHDAPGIAAEMRWIEDWWATGRPYFGICHGLQLAAQLLGARVGPPEHGRAEFGYYPLTSHAPDLVPDGLHAFQWHYYGADLPHGAERLASTDLYPSQIVRFGSARYGLQCHAEQSRAGQAYLRSMDPDGPRKPGGQSAEEEDGLAQRHGAAMTDWFRSFFGIWLRQAELRRASRSPINFIHHTAEGGSRGGHSGTSPTRPPIWMARTIGAVQTITVTMMRATTARCAHGNRVGQLGRRGHMREHFSLS